MSQHKDIYLRLLVDHTAMISKKVHPNLDQRCPLGGIAVRNLDARECRAFTPTFQML